MATAITNQQDVEEVTDEDIKLFKTTLLARRFPGLRDMADAHIKQLILADRKATGRKQEDPRSQRTNPKTEFYVPPPKRDTIPLSVYPPPFSPVNPIQAKDSVRRPWQECYLGLGNPFDGDAQAFRTDKHSDEVKCAAPFFPNCASQAKDTIRVDYYLNSADAESKALEKASMRARGLEHTAQLRELYETRRGKTLV